MSIKVNIEINVAAEGYTEHESAILAALAAHPSQGAAAVVTQPAAATLTTPVTATKEAADARIAEAKAKAATEAKAKADAAAKAKAAAEAKAAAAEAAAAEATVEEPAEEASEDLVGGAEPVAAYTLDQAVKEATARVSSGKAAEVKAALAGTGAKKVSELSGEGITAFMQALGL